MPEDPAGRCAVSVHYYTPAGFALLEEDVDWGKALPTWGSDADYQELNRLMDTLDARYASQGIPVIIGEYGCPKKNKEPESVRRFLTSVCEAALSRGGMCPVLWDITDLHYDRSTYQMTDSELNRQLLEVRDRYLPQSVKGDVNGDGAFTLLDAVMMQKYLLGTGTLTKSANGDLCEDGRINGFDLAWLKRMLIEK